MKFLQLEINNFLTISHTKLELDEKGLVLIQGENLDDTSADSNGAGKSTIADALCWVLFGKTARGDTGDDVVNEAAGKDCRVSVIIEDEGEKNFISRYRMDKTLKNSLVFGGMGDEGVIKHKATDKETQVEIIKFLGCSYDVFRAAVYMGQEEMPDMPGMTDKALKVLVEEASGIELLERAYKAARERVTIVDGALGVAQRDLEATLASIATDTESLGVSKEHHKDFEDGRVDRVKGFADKARAQAVKIKEAQATIADVDMAALKVEFDEIEIKLDGLKKGKDELFALWKILSAASLKQSEAQSEVRRITGVAKSLKTKLENTSSMIGADCGECGKVYKEDDLEHAVAVTRKSLKAELIKLKSAKETLEKAILSVTESQEAHDAYKDSMSDPTALTKRSGEISNAVLMYKNTENTIAAGKTFAKDMVTAAKNEKTAENPHDKSIISHNTRLDNLAKVMILQEADITKAEKRLTIAKDVVKVFGPAGVRAHILDTVTPYLNDRTAHYLTTLSDGNITAAWQTLTKTKKGEVREKFQIEVTNATGGKRFRSLSGGEKRKARLACALALQDLVASRATKPIGLWIGDEIDDALDGSGLERLMGVLEERARERGTVLVISHADLKDWIRNVIVVRKEDGSSTVSGMLVAA